jgi:DNA-binding transcriptional ArsR family regulator
MSPWFTTLVIDAPTSRTDERGRATSTAIEAFRRARRLDWSAMHPMSPSARFDIAAFGEVVADPSRAAMLLSLMDGLERPASELARIAGVSASTASSHLSRLLAGGFVLAEPRGRHRYFSLASDDVAHALEVIALHTTQWPRAASSDPARVAIARARTCYKHLAGELGVAWFTSLQRERLLRVSDGALTLAPRGVARFEDLGLTMTPWPSGKPCLDWTERRNHLGGALGVALTEHLLTMKWLARREERRALRITTVGRAGFAQFGMDVSAL